MTLQMYRMPNCHTSANRLNVVIGCAKAALLMVLLVFCVVLANRNLAFAAAEMASPAVILSVETEGNAISMVFDRPVSPKVIHLNQPARIVIDLPETNFIALDKGVRLPDVIKEIRYGLMSPGRSRIVLTLEMPAVATLRDVEDARAVQRITLETVEPTVFSKQVDDDALFQNTGEQDKKSRLLTAPAEKAENRFTLVIDPGHGGIDGGAEGSLGTREKDITLAFGLAIRDALKEVETVRVVMTRQTDVFVGLRERVKIARENSAELLLSIHGDSINLKDVRGATIYTLSDSASDAISNALANQENLADSIAGLPPMQPDPDMNSILVDLLRQETESFSRELATKIVVHLKENAVELINNPVRSAGFSVLTAPDVPSLLLEMGYLSNKDDELLMRDEKWRLRTAGVIAKAIADYSKNHRTRSNQP